MHTYTIYNDTDYFKTITEQIAATQSGDRIALISMLFEPSEQYVLTVTKELIAAAARGVRVRLIIDAHALMVTKANLPTGPLYWKRNIYTAKFPRRFYEKVQLLEALRQAGGEYEIINEPITWPTIPLAGRSHIKATVINEEAYIGGCNLGFTKQIDYMVRIRDLAIADWTWQLIDTIKSHKSAWLALHRQDIQFVPEPQTTIFVDAGVANQSLILQEAIRFIDEAKDWIVITCQFLPGGSVGRHLTQAYRRGVTVYSIFNHPIRQDKLTLPLQYLILEREKLRTPRSLFAGQLPLHHQRLHAKLIATEQGAIIGSHNYVTTGVRLGTAEIALLRRDPVFARDAVSILAPQLPETMGSKLQKLAHV